MLLCGSDACACTMARESDWKWLHTVLIVWLCSVRKLRLIGRVYICFVAFFSSTMIFNVWNFQHSDLTHKTTEMTGSLFLNVIFIYYESIFTSCCCLCEKQTRLRNWNREVNIRFLFSSIRIDSCTRIIYASWTNNKIKVWRDSIRMLWLDVDCA